MDKRELRILTVGNSFGEDTSCHLADIARALGFKQIKISLLYIGGCSINKHFENAKGDLADYRYSVNTGEGWTHNQGKRISEAVREEKWDYISIQHGTKDGSRYTLPESYANLEALIEYIKGIANKDAKIVFNMAWVMEPYSTHSEIRSYDGDQLLMYSKITEVTSTVVKNTKGLDIVSPAGTAIQNARATSLADKLSRDGFHLSYGLGRYIASLTFIKALTGVDIDNIEWMPEGVTEDERAIAIAAANAAVETPFEITKI
jgi:hypothetical protein